MERAAERAVSDEVARDGLVAPFLERLDQTRLALFHDHALLVDREHVDARPRAAHGDFLHDVVHRIGARRDQQLPVLQHRRQRVEIEIIRVHQRALGAEDQERGIDVHRIAALARHPVDAEAIAEMPFEPGDPHLIRHVRAGDEDVAARAGEVGRVEHGFELGRQEAQRLAVIGDGVVVIEDVVGQLRARGRGPARAAAEIILEQPAIGVALEIARAPRHRRFDDLVPDHQIAVARAGDAEALARPERRAEAAMMRHLIGAHDLDVRLFQHADQIIERRLAALDHPLRIAPARDQPVQPPREARHVERDRDVIGRNGRAFEPADDDFFERIPFIPRPDRGQGLGLGAALRRRVLFKQHRPVHSPGFGASASAKRTRRTSTSRATCRHSSVSRNLLSSLSKAPSCWGANSNQVRKSNSPPKSRQ